MSHNIIFYHSVEWNSEKNNVGPFVNKALTDSDKWKLKTEQIVVGPFYVSQVCSLFPDHNKQQCGPASAAASRVFFCQIWTDFDQVNVRITAVIFPDEHLLKQLSFTWFSINHVLVSNLIISIFWGALLSLNDLHLTSSEERLFLQHCIICLDHLHLIALRHIIRDIDWYLDHLMSVSSVML